MFSLVTQIPDGRTPNAFYTQENIISIVKCEISRENEIKIFNVKYAFPNMVFVPNKFGFKLDVLNSINQQT